MERHTRAGWGDVMAYPRKKKPKKEDVVVEYPKAEEPEPVRHSADEKMQLCWYPPCDCQASQGNAFASSAEFSYKDAKHRGEEDTQVICTKCRRVLKGFGTVAVMDAGTIRLVRAE